MEVQPIVKHQSADKRVERESQPMDEVCEKHNPLMGLGGRDNLPFCRESVSNLLGYIASLPELRDVLLLNGGGHPLASSSGSGHDWSAFSNEEKLKAWALELEDGRTEDEEGCG